MVNENKQAPLCPVCNKPMIEKIKDRLWACVDHPDRMLGMHTMHEHPDPRMRPPKELKK